MKTYFFLFTLCSVCIALVVDVVDSFFFVNHSRRTYVMNTCGDGLLPEVVIDPAIARLANSDTSASDLVGADGCCCRRRNNSKQHVSS